MAKGLPGLLNDKKVFSQIFVSAADRRKRDWRYSVRPAGSTKTTRQAKRSHHAEVTLAIYLRRRGYAARVGVLKHDAPTAQGIP